MAICLRLTSADDLALIDPLVTNIAAHRFYESLGFKFTERRQFDEESDCFIYRLDRADWRHGD